MKFKLAIIGFGTVGQGLVEILNKKKSILKTEHDFEFNIVAVSDLKKGSVFQNNGLDPEKLLNCSDNINDYPDGTKGWDSIKTIQESNADIIVETSFTNIATGEPATSHIKAALKSGKHVITTNKGPSVLFHQDLENLAAANNVFYKIEGTVMSGTPILNTALKNLAGCEIKSIRGILNGTSNFILSEMERGLTYQQALSEAQSRGYAEADPSGDIEGWDTLAKIIILSNVVLKKNITQDSVLRQGISHLTVENIQNAIQQGYRWKLIGGIININGNINAFVAPQRLPLNDPLASIMGAENAITFETDLLGRVTITGPGAGKKETGFAILSDLLEINRELSVNKKIHV